MIDFERGRISHERRHRVATFERLRDELAARSAGRSHDQHPRAAARPRLT